MRSGNPKGESIYTLAQSGTGNKAQKTTMLTGKGSDLSDNKVAQGRARRKNLSQRMSLSLISVAEKEEDEKLIKSLWNTYNCQNEVTLSGGRIFGHYCKNRMCTLCLSIRKATIINSYYPIISQWEDAQFVTLTAQAVYAKSLDKRIDQMVQGFQIIKDRMKTRHARGKGPKLIGVRSLEANFNPKKRTYNPHLHLIVQTKEIAEVLKAEWLKLLTPKFAYKGAQKVDKIYSTEKGLIEIIKYGSKIFSDPEVRNNAMKGPDTKMYMKALHNIFKAMKGHRLFSSFGFRLPKQEKEVSTTTLVVDAQPYHFDPLLMDWIGPNGETLTGYQMNPMEDYISTEGLDFILE